MIKLKDLKKKGFKQIVTPEGSYRYVLKIKKGFYLSAMVVEKEGVIIQGWWKKENVYTMGSIDCL